jgi:hypothetical protein
MIATSKKTPDAGTPDVNPALVHLVLSRGKARKREANGKISQQHGKVKTYPQTRQD